MPVVTDFTALLSGSYWTGFEVTDRPFFLTFSFPTLSPAAHGDPDAMGASVASFQALDAADQALARAALAEWADACGLTLLEVSAGRGDIEFAWYDFTGTLYDGAAGIAFFPGGGFNGLSDPYFTDHASVNPNAGDVFLDLGFADAAGQPDYGLLLHEIGHALGLKHPFEMFGSHPETLDPAVDTTANTVMSYTGPAPTTLGPLDLDAAAHIYGGANRDGRQVGAWTWDTVAERLTQTGKKAAEVIQGVSVEDSMAGKGGDDVLLGLEGADTLNGGDGDDLGFGGAEADELIGGDGADTLYGGAGEDALNGQDGADELWGEAGDDVLRGLAGDDLLVGNDGADRLDGGADNDSLYGDEGKDRLTGGDGGDLLAGGGGKDRLDGGAGADFLFGDAGDDRLEGGADGDQLAGGEGDDLLSGQAGDDNIFGDGGADTLEGGAGSDSLSGGAGADRMLFGADLGFDVVFGFEDGQDVLAFEGIAGVAAIGDLGITDDGFGNTVITAGAAGTVILVGIAAAQVTAADVVFL